MTKTPHEWHQSFTTDMGSTSTYGCLRVTPEYVQLTYNLRVHPTGTVYRLGSSFSLFVNLDILHCRQNTQYLTTSLKLLFQHRFTYSINRKHSKEKSLQLSVWFSPRQWMWYLWESVWEKVQNSKKSYDTLPKIRAELDVKVSILWQLKRLINTLLSEKFESRFLFRQFWH